MGSVALLFPRVEEVGAEGAIIAFVGERCTAGLGENLVSARFFFTDENISLRGCGGQ